MRKRDPFVLRDTGKAIKNFHVSEWESTERVGRAVHAEPLRLTLDLKRLALLFVLATAGLCLVFFRVFALQVQHGQQFRDTAEGNRLRIQVLPAPRGVIVDRHGVPLVQNVPRFQLHLRPQTALKKQVLAPEIVTLFSRILGKSDDVFTSELTQALASKNEVVVLADFLTHEQALQLAISTEGLIGLTLEYVPTRFYPDGTYVGSIVGYTGPLNPEEYQRLKVEGYRFNDAIGRSGIEASYESELRGVDGAREFEIESSGRALTPIAEHRALPGKQLMVTIDLEVQKTAVLALEKSLRSNGARAGAAIVMDARDGSIITLASLPTYDPNLFTQRRTPEDQEALDRLFTDPLRPLFNRAIAGQYPPGSTIKPALSLYALATGSITPTSTVLSTGGIRVGEWFFPDWKAGGHGITDVRKAIADSVNTFFYTIGVGGGNIRAVGPTGIRDSLLQVGFAEPTGIDVPGEEAGFLGSPEWKQKTFGEPWYVGDTYHSAIGQGYTLATPLQVAYMTGLIATDGMTLRPHVTKKTHEKPLPKIAVDAKHFSVVREGMRMTVTDGSGRRLASSPLNIAGKTGTAQGAPGKRTHAWFTSFAPYENPRYVVTVFLEEGGEGSTSAVPVAEAIYNKLLELEEAEKAREDKVLDGIK
ncbi:MAG: penicillin-binding protein 2 [bacterium]|nr:penicillin-binding protein 2 [bacterium]